MYLIQAQSADDVSGWVKWIHVGAAIVETRTDDKLDAVRQLSARITVVEKLCEKLAETKRVGRVLYRIV